MRMILGLALATMIAVPAAAKVPLREVSEIDDNMLWVALAIEISDRCDAISPRTLKGLSYLFGLKNRAESLGYTRAEIKAYVDSDAEKARMRQRGEAYVRARGLNPDSDADLCTLGLQEIEKGSQVGAFLRAK
ncbi:hypothetical protein GLS40_12635 [Pseudooceanicola sp. 216_PA32_1]|uniref:NADH dehydrogenase subunit E n=1 Tax=Pseudooceanicola pacificus TaxID=2676438 RepID=A0A844WG94_9RHOB|nr:DUF5333 domain-containing protein [Pseudooceanicola pacificus]MWB78879.1 hypothetical protein [Pseudooceanicola pacificus]